MPDLTTIFVTLVFLILMAAFPKFVLGAVRIKEDEVGQIIKKFSFSGKSLPKGRVVALDNEAGYQAKVLAPGLYFGYWSWMYKIVHDKAVVISPGQIGLVLAKDGETMPPERILAKKVECSLYQDAEAFIRNGGQKGKQPMVLTSGVHRINKALFEVTTVEVSTIDSNKIGIITTLDGAAMPDGQVVAPVVRGHDNFQDPDAFVKNGGCRGPQEQVLLAGQYNLNPWFVEVELEDLLEIPIGHVGVVVSSIGEDKADISGEAFTHGNIVPKGGRGVWNEPLYPGRHPVNTRCMNVELVPTTNIVLNWAKARTESHKLDEKLSTITVRSTDGFTFNLDVSQIINIGAKEAPFVISRVGSVQNLVAQVLEPIIGNYFRNSAQKYSVLDFLTNRSERQREAREHITNAIRQYNVQSVDTLIGDITPPPELMKPLTDRRVAEEQKTTYTVQMEAQKTRQTLESETALANKQAELMNEQQNILIAERQAAAAIKKAEGESAAVSRRADGEAEAIKKRGIAEAEIVAVKGRNEAESIRSRGEAEAAVIEAKGRANAEAARKGREALGDNFATLRIFEALAENKIKLVPEVQSGDGVGSILGILTKKLHNNETVKALLNE